jgi:hypothetical protein
MEGELKTPPEFEDFSYRYYQAEQTQRLHPDRPSSVGFRGD